MGKITEYTPLVLLVALQLIDPVVDPHHHSVPSEPLHLEEPKQMLYVPSGSAKDPCFIS